MEQVRDDALWKTLEKLKSEGKIRTRIALGPAIGWLYEGVNSIRERDLTSVQHIYTCSSNIPGEHFTMRDGSRQGHTMFLIRVTHSSECWKGATPPRRFPPTDHRSHRPELAATSESSNYDFSKMPIARLIKLRCNGCWQITCVTLPNIYNEEQLVNLQKRPTIAPLLPDDMAKIEELYSANRHRRGIAKEGNSWSCRKRPRRCDLWPLRCAKRCLTAKTSIMRPQGGGYRFVVVDCGSC
jgi:hypothetical protein